MCYAVTPWKSEYLIILFVIALQLVAAHHVSYKASGTIQKLYLIEFVDDNVGTVVRSFPKSIIQFVLSNTLLPLIFTTDDGIVTDCRL